MHIRTQFILLCFFLTNLTSKAQGPFGESVIQDPLKDMSPSFFPQIPIHVKSFTYVFDKDTILKSFFDKNGNETSKFEEFRKSIPLYKSVNKFIGKLKSQTEFYLNDILKSTTTYKYGKAGNLIEWKRDNIVYDKQSQKASSVLDVHWIIEYDNKRIKTAYLLNQQNTKTQFYNYLYDITNKLIETDEMQWKDKYEYNDSLVTKKYRIFKNDNSVVSYIDYKYNKDKYLIETTDKNFITEYNYNLKILKTIKYQKRSDSSHQEINFNYNNDLITKVVIYSNGSTLNFTSPLFIFKNDYLFGSRKLKEMNLEMNFSYDKYKNVTEIKYSVNGLYKYSKRFLYEYY